MIDHASILSVNDESMLLALLNMLHEGRLHFSYLNTIQFDMAPCKWLVQAQTQIKRTLYLPTIIIHLKSQFKLTNVRSGLLGGDGRKGRGGSGEESGGYSCHGAVPCSFTCHFTILL